MTLLIQINVLCGNILTVYTLWFVGEAPGKSDGPAPLPLPAHLHHHERDPLLVQPEVSVRI
jgi:hypothetical protein